MPQLQRCLSPVASAAGARSLDDIISAGSIRVGVNPSFATAKLDDKSQLTGFDVDLANKLAEMLGVKVEFVTVDSRARIPSLTAGLVDIVLGGMTRTPERAPAHRLHRPGNDGNARCPHAKGQSV